MNRRWLLLALLIAAESCLAQPSPQALATFATYTAQLEARLARQHQQPAELAPADEQRLRRGDLLITSFATSEPAGALLHHWRGTAFLPGATASAFAALLRDFNAYPQSFAPEVLRAAVLTRHGDATTVALRVRQKHILTVVLDTTYNVAFGTISPTAGFETSRSTSIHEIAAADTPAEHPLSPAEEHGFLWRQNTYWTFTERDGGLFVELESVSLSRSIPTGLAWAVRPFVESVPRDSLTFTLRAVARALTQ